MVDAACWAGTDALRLVPELAVSLLFGPVGFLYVEVAVLRHRYDR